MILKKKYRHKYTRIDNYVFDEPKIKVDTLGMYCYLMSKPQGWEIKNSHIETRFNIGKEKRRRIFKELSDLGLAQLVAIRKNGRFCGKEYHLFEEPQKVEKKKTDRRVTRRSEKQTVEKPVCDLVTTDSLVTTDLNNKPLSLEKIKFEKEKEKKELEDVNASLKENLKSPPDSAAPPSYPDFVKREQAKAQFNATKHLFADSPHFVIESFCAAAADTQIAKRHGGIDFESYYFAVAAYAKRSGRIETDWIAVFESFAARDYGNGKLVLKDKKSKKHGKFNNGKSNSKTRKDVIDDMWKDEQSQ